METRVTKRLVLVLRLECPIWDPNIGMFEILLCHRNISLKKKPHSYSSLSNHSPHVQILSKLIHILQKLLKPFACKPLENVYKILVLGSWAISLFSVKLKFTRLAPLPFEPLGPDEQIGPDDSLLKVTRWRNIPSMGKWKSSQLLQSTKTEIYSNRKAHCSSSTTLRLN